SISRLVNISKITSVTACRPCGRQQEEGTSADRDYPHPKLTRVNLSARVQVRLRRKSAFDINTSSAQLHPVSRQADDPFGHEFCFDRVANHDDIAPMVAAKAGQPAVDHATVARFQRGHHAFPLNHHCREYEVLNEQAGDGGPERHAQENVTTPGLWFDRSLS